jgi:transposase
MNVELNELFAKGLGLQRPWEVTALRFDETRKRLDIHLDFPRGSEFPCPECGASCKVYDTNELSWRHLNFFEHLTYLQARVPRTNCPAHGARVAHVPWARPDTGFTLLFEALIVEMGRNGLTAKALARLIGEHDTRVWRVLEHYVGVARARTSFADVERVGVDETSRASGHDYISTFVDMVAARVLFVTEGKDHTTIEEFKKDLEQHGGGTSQVAEFSLDMSAAFQKGIRETFPAAELTFDPFHVVKLMNEAVDEVRREEQRTAPELKKTRYSWLKDESKQKEAERQAFEPLKNSRLKTARAWRIKEGLRDLYNQPPEEAAEYFNRWYFWATHSRLPAVIRAAKTFRAHQAGILRWFESGLSNGLLEGLNSLIQAAKARARGFRSARKMKTIIYLLLSKLDFQLPSALPTAVQSRLAA